MSNDTITLRSGLTFEDSVYTNDTGGEYTINISDAAPGHVSTITPTYTFDTDTINISGYNTVSNMIDLDEVEEMCNEYPGLKNVYEKFKHVYNLVKQDWIGKQNESK
jgi:hypothetical protein|tara:strand:+ start:362 stop:682 length:321 start_codon:yes stop_codon:yes gene_type:complete